MDKLYQYVQEHSHEESDALKWIRRQTALRTNHSRMLSGPVQGNLLTILTNAIGAVRALELGTFTGYSSVCIASGLAEGGHLDTLEINDELDELIHEGWIRAGVADKITLHTGDALATLARMTGPYDIAFIDANKRDYCAYFEAVLPLVRPGGLILADNTLWDGKILQEPMPTDAQTVEIAHFNEKVSRDPRVITVMLPLRDGLTIMRKN